MSMSLPIGISPLDSLHQVICNLNLKEVDIALESHLARAAQGDKAYATFLLELLELEVRARQDTTFSKQFSEHSCHTQNIWTSLTLPSSQVSMGVGYGSCKRFALYTRLGM